MELLLWRHAEAEDGAPDHKRALTAHGEKQARRMAQWLRAHLPENTRILTSPARRCVQTVSALELPYTEDSRLSVAANVDDLIQASGWPKEPGCVLLVGHQPTLGELGARLMTGFEASWSVKKGALWWFHTRERPGSTQTVLRTVITPEFL